MNYKKDLNFTSSKYSRFNTRAWEYGQENAEILLEVAKYFNNLIDLLKNNVFYEKLNLHRSTSNFKSFGVFIDLDDRDLTQQQLEDSPYFKSNMTEEKYISSLEISNWTYGEIITSAAYYVLESFYLKALNGPVEYYEKNLHFYTSVFFGQNSIYLINSNFSNEIFTALRSTNIFSIMTYACLSGYLDFINDYNNGEKSFFQAVSRFHFIEQKKITVLPILQSFNFEIPEEFSIFICSLTSETKDIYFVKITFELYQKHLSSRMEQSLLSELEFQCFHYILGNSTYLNEKFFKLEYIKNNFKFYDINSFCYYMNLCNQTFAFNAFKKNFFSLFFANFSFFQYVFLPLYFSNFGQDYLVIYSLVGPFGPLGPPDRIPADVSGVSRPSIPVKPQTSSNLTTKQSVLKKNMLKSEQHEKKDAMVKRIHYVTERTKQVKIYQEIQDNNLHQNLPSNWNFELAGTTKNNTNSYVYFTSDKSKFSIIGNYGNYDDVMSKNKKICDEFTEKNLNSKPITKFQVEHIAREALYSIFDINRSKMECITTPADFNKAKENPNYFNPEHRDFRYTADQEQLALDELLQQKLENEHIYLFEKLENDQEFMAKHGEFHFLLRNRYIQRIPATVDRLTLESQLLGLANNFDGSIVGGLLTPAACLEQSKLVAHLKQEDYCIDSEGRTLVKPDVLVEIVLNKNIELAQIAKSLSFSTKSGELQKQVDEKIFANTHNLVNELKKRILEHKKAYETGMVVENVRNEYALENQLNAQIQYIQNLTILDRDIALKKSYRANIGNTNKHKRFPEFNTSSKSTNDTFRTYNRSTSKPKVSGKSRISVKAKVKVKPFVSNSKGVPTKKKSSQLNRRIRRQTTKNILKNKTQNFTNIDQNNKEN